MKPTMIFAIAALAAIVVASSFGLQLMPGTPVSIPPSAEGGALYVCHAGGTLWDTIAVTLRPFMHYIIVLFFFAVMILLFNWGWAMYQSLIADKFKRETFSNSWKLTKFTFWVAVAVTIVAATPNHFKTVKIQGASGDWILCERDTPGATAVRASAVFRD